ncbi:hypothetical protein ACFXTH_040811 [Malus domestica]
MTNNFCRDFCDGCVESIDHILRRCNRAKLVWNQLGIFHGLTLAWRLGYRKVLVELDSDVAVTLIMDFNSSMHPLAHLITACRELLRMDWICSVSHVYREKNRVTDGMTALGHKFDIGLHVFYEPPPLVDRLIFEDEHSTH